MPGPMTGCSGCRSGSSAREGIAMQANMNGTDTGFLARHRTLILLVSVILFLPPLAFIFQSATGDLNFCGTWCPRMFYAVRKGSSLGEFVGGCCDAPSG